MALFTTYLGYLKVINRRVCGQLIKPEHALEDVGLREPKIYYIMRNRGNNEVAPSEELLSYVKEVEKKLGTRPLWLWHKYLRRYLDQIGSSDEAKEWMRKVAEESLDRDVVLVCFEKDHTQCHRSLLADAISRSHPEVNFVGELSYESS